MKKILATMIMITAVLGSNVFAAPMLTSSPATQNKAGFSQLFCTPVCKKITPCYSGDCKECSAVPRWCGKK